MATNLWVLVAKNRPFTDPVTGEYFEGGYAHLFDRDTPAELDQANRLVASGAGAELVSMVQSFLQIAWPNITGKPSSFTPSAHTHSASEVVSGQFANARISAASVTQHQGALALAIAQVAGLQAALDAKVASSEKGAANGVASLDAAGLLQLVQIPTLDASKTGTGVFDAARIPNLDWSKIIPATRPDTLAGYGITDALTATQVGQQIQAAIDALVGGAPGALDTLNELAQALGDDPDAVANLTNAVASKLDASLWQAASAAVDGFMSKEDKAKLDGIEVGATGDMTGAEIKAAYESESDTNAFTDAEKTKLGGIAAQATKNATDAALRDRSTHTGTQAQDTIDNLPQDLADRPLRSEMPFASIVQYSSTDTVTDINSGADTPIVWDELVLSDSAITVSGDEISVAEEGRYWVYASLAYEDRSASESGIRASVGVFFSVNGVARKAIGMGGYIRNSSGHDEASASISEVLVLSPGDVVRVVARRMSGAEAIYLRASESVLVVDRKGGKSPALAAQTITDIAGLVDALDGRADKSNPVVSGAILGAGNTRLQFVSGVVSESDPTKNRNRFIPRNDDDTDWNWGRDFGFDQGRNAWYFDGELRVGGSAVWTVGTLESRHINRAAITSDLSYNETPGGVVAFDANGPGWPVEYACGLHAHFNETRQWQLVFQNKSGWFRRGHSQNPADGWSEWSRILTHWDLGAADGVAELDASGVLVPSQRPDGATTLGVDSAWSLASVPPGVPVRITANSTQTLPDDLSDWFRQVIVERGVTVVFEVGNNTVLDADGNAADLTDPASRTVTGPASFVIATAATNTLEIW